MRGAFMKKVKDLSAKAAHSTLVVSIFILAAAFAVFSLLPVIFEESGPSGVEGYDGGYGASSNQDSGFLPLLKNLNPAAYFKKAFRFFSRGKDDASQSVYYNDDDVLEDIFKSESSVVSGGTQTVGRGMAEEDSFFEEEAQISPDDTGYYYEGKRYKYGEYPANVPSEEIEKAISKWHNNQAAQSGRSAVYIQDEKGDLIVKYLNGKEISDYFAMLKNQRNPSVEGLGIAQEDGSIYTGLLAGKGEKARDFGSLTSFTQNENSAVSGDTAENIESQFNTLMYKAKEIERNYAKSASASYDKDKEEAGQKPAAGPDLEKYLNDTSDNFRRRFFDLLASEKKTETKVPSEFKNSPAKVDENIYGAFEKKLKEKVTLAVNIWDTEEFKKDLAGKPVRFYSRYPLPEVIKEKLRDEKIFFNNFTNPDYKENSGFTETFFKKTAMEEILDQLNADKTSIEEIKKEYEEMDKKREKIKNLYPKDSSVIFILGKDPRNSSNMIVASEKSFLNVYAEGRTPQWIRDYGAKSTTISVPIKELSKKITQKGVTVITANREIPPPIPGVQTINIPRARLVSIFSDQVWINEKDIAKAIFKGKREASRALYRSLQQRQEDKQKAEESLKSMSTAANEAVNEK